MKTETGMVINCKPVARSYQLLEGVKKNHTFLYGNLLP